MSTTKELDALVLLNPVAAHSASEGLTSAVRTAIAARSQVVRIHETRAGSAGRKAAHAAVSRAVAQGCSRVIAVGGDGTVALAAACLIDRPQPRRTVALAIVPTGTANVLARELGIPLEYEHAVSLAFDGEQSIELDAIRTRHGPVLTQVGLGLDAEMIRHTTRRDQIQSGRLAYVAAFLRRALRHRPSRFEIEVDGRVLYARGWQITIANIGALGAPPFTWGPGIDPTDGALDLCIYRADTWKELLTLARRLLTGRHHQDAQTQYLSVRHRVTIRTRRPVRVQGDGEALGHTPITLDVEPRAVSVIVLKAVAEPEPAPAAASSSSHMRPSPGVPTAPPSQGADDATIHEDVDTLVAQHSRTWLLQGWPRHPFAFLSALDTALYLRVNTLPLGSMLEWMLVAVSTGMHYGEGWAIVAAVLLAIDFRAGFSVSVEALPVLWATMLTVNFPLKRLFRRQRPFHVHPPARVLGPRPLDSSFPSGHTAAAFAGALLFGEHVPSGAPIFHAIALLVGFSRVYLGVHYPSDVVFGAIAGRLLAGGYLSLLRAVIAG